MSGRLWLFALTLVLLIVVGDSAAQGQDDLPATISALETRVAELEAAATPPPPPASPVAPSPGELLYVADTAGGFDAWSLPGPPEGSPLPDWVVERGMLVSRGFGPGEPVSAPFTAPSDDYAVEVEAQILRFNRFPETGGNDFLVMARGAIFGGVGIPCPGRGPQVDRPMLHLDAWFCGFLVGKAFAPGQEWHTYRLEVEGNELRLFVDGELQLQERSNRTLSGGEVGVLSHRVEVGIRRFAVYSLAPEP
jgi:hypothetical protein